MVYWPESNEVLPCQPQPGVVAVTVGIGSFGLVAVDQQKKAIATFCVLRGVLGQRGHDGSLGLSAGWMHSMKP